MNRFTALICAWALFLPASAATAFFPLRDVKPGLRGIGKTVFQGSRVEEFQVEILGVLEDASPKQSIILARLSGGPLANAGVLQGMSGSPVYIDGKLVGAVALGFPFSKEAIAGIQPIEQMVANTAPPAAAPTARMNYAQWAKTWSRQFQPGTLVANASTSPPELRAISTPLAFSGFTESAINFFSTALRNLGFEPQTGVGSGAPTTRQYVGHVEPGSMISVELMSGDWNVTADGTVTYIDGSKVYAFGHRFLASGSTDLPFARADVVTLLPNLNSSFKISTARELVGSLTSDTSTAVAGEIGRPAHLIPMHIEVRDPIRTNEYDINLIDDRLFTPLLAQMALFSTIDATERSAGAGTMRVRGQVDFDGGVPPLRFNDVFAADSNSALQASFNLVVPLAFSLQAGFQNLRVKNLSFSFDASEQKRQLEIQDVWLSKTEAKPGDTISVSCLLTGENGLEVRKTATYRIPIGAPTGRLFFTVSDASMLNFSELAGLNSSSVPSARELVQILNEIRPNDKAYVRVWRQEPSFTLPGADLTDPPPSAALILSKSSSSLSSGSSILLSRGAQVAEVPISPGDYAVTGSKTVQVEVKE
ncbi:MAG: SpoIVB peptidase S55 domain-containing protein [Bryobacteraceae bacterium]